MAEGEGFAEEVTLENLDEFTSVLRMPNEGGGSTPEAADAGDTDGGGDDGEAEGPPEGMFEGERFRVDLGRRRARTSTAGATEPRTSPDEIDAETLVIQVRPHDNGEVFLSKTAVDQNRDFFGFPFEGETTPKKEVNKAYPQRDPAPVVDLTVVAPDGTIPYELVEFELTTVYYESKSEIRITIPPAIARHLPELSILVMSEAESDDRDYTLDIYMPGSTAYDDYLDECDQEMPSGGKPESRRFGWVNETD